MAFITEYIPEADKKKYNITDDSNFYRAGSSDWTVDRGRGIFLVRRTGPTPEGIPGQNHWAFFWGGHLLDVLLETIDSGGDFRGGSGWEHDRVLRIDGLNQELQAKREQIIDDLRSALISYRGMGVLSTRTSYEVTLDTLNKKIGDLDHHSHVRSPIAGENFFGSVVSNEEICASAASIGRV
jgi:hypothetical protein